MTSYSLAEKELFCSISLQNKYDKDDLIFILQRKAQFAKELSQFFLEGDEKHTLDRNKAENYKKQYEETQKQIAILQEKPFMPEQNGANDPKAITYKKPKLHTKHIYDFFDWYNGTRLFITRTNSVCACVYKPFLPAAFSLASFLYTLGFTFDMGVCLNNTFRKAQSNTEENLSYGQRFINSVTKTGRIARLANTGRWAIINILSYVFPHIAIPLNIAGFSVDTMEEYYTNQRTAKFYQATFSHLAQEKENTHTEPNVLDSEKKANITHLAAMTNFVQGGFAAFNKRRAYTHVLNALLFVAFIASCFTPLLAAHVSTAAAFTILITGSVLMGFGRNLVNKIMQPKPKPITDYLKEPMTKSVTVSSQRYMNGYLNTAQVKPKPTPTQNYPLPVSVYNRKSNDINYAVGIKADCVLFRQKNMLISEDELNHQELKQSSVGRTFRRRGK